MTINSQVFCPVDYDRDGKHMAMLEVPQSTNSSGWATEYVPMTVVKHGSGPTALLFGGNHGDEYEGPVTLTRLARALQPEQVQGRIIILPMLNPPAVAAGTRLSPLDGRNMNRAFPGRRDDTLTGIIADYVTRALFPLADLVVDIHSGGRSAHFLPSVDMHRVPDDAQMQRMLESGLAWGAPYVFVYRDVAGEGLLQSSAEALGKTMLGTEIGSASQFGKGTLSVVSRGVCNVLRLHGILDGRPDAPAQPPQIVEAGEREDYIMAPISGIFEPFCELGDQVRAGESVGQILSVEQPFAEPLPVLARTSGLLFSRRAFPLTAQGDCLATLARLRL